MSQLEDQQAAALQISTELAATLVALGVDWNDAHEMRQLAREALAYKPTDVSDPIPMSDIEGRARLKFYGLVALMLRTMEEGAQEGENIHGGEVWKAVGRALWAEKESGAK